MIVIIKYDDNSVINSIEINVNYTACVAESKSSWIPNPVNPLDSSWIWFV